MSDMARGLLMAPDNRIIWLHKLIRTVATVTSAALGGCIVPANIQPLDNTTNLPPEIVSGDPDFLALPFLPPPEALQNGFALTITARDYDVHDQLRAHLFRLIGGEQIDELIEINLLPTSADGIERRNAFAVHKWCKAWGANTWYVTAVVSDREFPLTGLPPKENSATRTWVITCPG